MTAASLLNKPKTQRKAILLNYAGESAIELSNNFVYTKGEDKEDPDVILAKFKNFCMPEKINRYLSNIGSGVWKYQCLV